MLPNITRKHSEGISKDRFQEMKYTNPNWKTEDEENIILSNYFFNVKSSLLISIGEENGNNY